MTKTEKTIQKTETATFGAGCFWHIQEVFGMQPGVLKATAGYSGGRVKDPTYEDVCTGKTGHAEAVEVLFDPARITYEKLLDIFWMIHDPTQEGRQGWDVGDEYRSVIFYHSESQKKAAELSKKNHQKELDKPITTQVLPAKAFYPAEDYHQNFLAKHRRKVCGIF